MEAEEWDGSLEGRDVVVEDAVVAWIVKEAGRRGEGKT